MKHTDSRSRRASATHTVTAEQWLARRDRGLSPAEQQEFDRWIRDPAHARSLAELEGPFAALDRLAALRPPADAAPDPDLLNAPRRSSLAPRPRAIAWGAIGFAAAAAMVFGVLPNVRTLLAPPPAVERTVLVRHAAEELTLPDGSTVALKPGSRVESVFTREERRVRLVAGDAHFDVVKDATRPFIVEAGQVAVRAVGTAFTVSASAATVEVVVTEGRVRVDDTGGRSLLETTTSPPDPTTKATASASHPLGESLLAAGHSVVIPVAAGTPSPAASTVATPESLERATAWKTAWLEFSEMPLAEVVREFNRHARSATQRVLKVANSATGRVLVSGTFRADGTEAFVRLLKSSFGIDATARADGSVVLIMPE
ncbi:FecR family protein [Horticoccus sp. 23ND18S-11]|uniref:FecR family protein n=1 Tax=Horticoccus sp. 23ND18S-11 TaxID=3391832 RepID=UPI0039C8F02A